LITGRAFKAIFVDGLADGRHVRLSATIKALPGAFPDGPQVHHFIEDGINVDVARPGRNFDTLAVRELAIVRNLTGQIRLGRVLRFGTGVVTERDRTAFSGQNVRRSRQYVRLCWTEGSISAVVHDRGCDVRQKGDLKAVR
jgi:hypothetical protein